VVYSQDCEAVPSGEGIIGRPESFADPVRLLKPFLLLKDFGELNKIVKTGGLYLIQTEEKPSALTSDSLV
jgi:hypothetical protein